jgi:iron complex transport system ATP-binding protein
VSEALAAEGIEFGYAGRPLFRGFSFRLETAEFAGLVGPNGSGKTTLLRLLSGTFAPVAGAVRLLGDPIARLAPRERARRLAVVPQESRILFDYTVLEVALMGRFSRLGPLGMESRADVETAERALSEVELGGAAARRLNELSSGERQRVFIARALAQEPAVLLLDEPTSFLDIRHRLQIYEILARLNRERGLAILTVSHDLNLAARYCGRLALIRAGELVATGPPSQVIRPDRIREVFETDVEVASDPRTAAPFIIPYPEPPVSGGQP